MARKLTRVILQIDSGVYIPDTGHTVTIKTDEGSPVLIATAVESPVSSGNYVATWTEQEMYGFWYVDGSIKTEWGRIWLGTVVGNVNYLTNFDILGALNVSGSANISGSVRVLGFVMPISPTTGYILTSDANGVGTWQAPSASASGSGTTNHALLTNLDYASSGHTGFAGTGVVNNFTANQHLQVGVQITGSILATGSMTMVGNITATIFTGDGSGLTNVTGSLTKDHAGLTNLAYATSGHTGFESQAEFQFVSSSVATDINTLRTGINSTGSLLGSHIADTSIHFTSGSIDHSKLQFLDYASSGHSGFAGTGIINNFTVNQHLQVGVQITGSILATGSMVMVGPITATSFVGDGVALTNVTGSLTKDHAGLTNLTYATSGHTGFESQVDFQFVSGSIATSLNALAAEDIVLQGEIDATNALVQFNSQSVAADVNTLRTGINTTGSVLRSHIADTSIHFTSGSIDHSKLQFLDYASSGHTGFAGTGVVNTFTQGQHFQADVQVTGSVEVSGNINIGTFLSFPNSGDILDYDGTTLTLGGNVTTLGLNGNAGNSQIVVGASGQNIYSTDGGLHRFTGGNVQVTGSVAISKRLITGVVYLLDSATVNTDASLGNLFIHSGSSGRTFDVPTNALDGQKIIWRLSNTGSVPITHTFTTGSAGAFRFGTDVTGSTPIAAGKMDYLGAIYNSTASRWDALAYVKGY